MTITIEQFDPRVASEAELRELWEYYLDVQAEDMPDDPPTPFEKQVAEWQMIFQHNPVVRWILRDKGILAVGVVVYDVESNLENGFCRVQVHQDHRGRGLARKLATPMFDHLEEAGRSRIDTWIKDGTAAESLAERLGMRSVYAEKRSRLLLSDLDMGLMRSWMAKAEERAADYSLLFLELPLPDEIVEDFSALAEIMNTAPREDFQAEDEKMTAEMWRDIESEVLAAKSQLHTCIAVHEPSGAFAGYTQIQTQDLQPDLAWQWDTGVHPDHRNKGLGRWLKAAMIEKVTTEHPAVQRVDTYNAGSNRPMLDINVAMGFKPIHLSHAWQGDLATVRDRFDA